MHQKFVKWTLSGAIDEHEKSLKSIFTYQIKGVLNYAFTKADLGKR